MMMHADDLITKTLLLNGENILHVFYALMHADNPGEHNEK